VIQVGIRNLRESEIARGAFAFALIFSLFVQALIPTGWMPASIGSDGRVTLVICSGSGTQEISVASGDGVFADGADANDHAPDGKDHRLDQTCSFAAALQVAHVSSSVEYVVPVALSLQHDTPAATTHAVVAAYAGPPLGSRAPPRA
jgi:hypothetical protein